MSIEELYMNALALELGTMNTELKTDKIRSTIYSGELAFSLHVKCIQLDIPPIGYIPDRFLKYYKFHMIDLEHDMLMLILVQLRDVLNMDECIKYMHPSNYGSKKSRISGELSSMNLSHMGKWIICSKNGKYSITISSIPYILSSRISKVLFSW